MNWNRTAYRVVLIVSFLGINAIILFGISAVLGYLNTGADRATILHLPKDQAPGYLPKLVWAPLANEGRPISKQTLSELERDYLKAWHVRAIALETNNPYGVADYYTDSARTKLYDIIKLNSRKRTTIKSTTLTHHPTLEFYSADGKIAVLTDKHVELIEEVYQDQQWVAQHRELASYQIMLLLEDGFWRIRHLVKLSTEQVEKTIPRTPQLHRIPNCRGVNYYPKQQPWNMFGTSFRDGIIAQDFEKIRQMGLNTIRIFVPYETFGKARVDPEKITQLRRTLDIAEEHDLKVMVTLFDFYGDYRLSDWTLTHRHAEEIVTALKSHKALLAWDIKNEPDLDFQSRGKTQVMAWLQELLKKVKSWDTQHPVTIGWSNPEAALHLAKEVDFVSFHYYREPSEFKRAFQLLQTAVPDTPIVLQEYGHSSYDGLWNAFLGSEEAQADYFEAMQEVLAAEDLPYLFWTLYDFESIPNEVVGRLPWRKARQRHFGILNAEGKPKTAYELLVTKK